jgi:archaellum component FlaC
MKKGTLFTKKTKSIKEYLNELKEFKRNELEQLVADLTAENNDLFSDLIKMRQAADKEINRLDEKIKLRNAAVEELTRVANTFTRRIESYKLSIKNYQLIIDNFKVDADRYSKLYDR